MLKRRSFYGRYDERRRRAVVRRLRRDVPELRVAETPALPVRALALAASALPGVLLLAALLAP